MASTSRARDHVLTAIQERPNGSLARRRDNEDQRMNKSYECTLCYSDGSSTTHQVEIEDDFNDGLVA